MKHLFFTLFAFLLALPLSAQEPITVRGKTASIIRLESKATGEVGWILDERLESDERSYRDLAAKRLIVVPPVAGRYVCHSFSVEAGKPSVQKYIVIAEGGPAPPDPGPPVETIATKLAAAFSDDKAAGAGSEADKVSLGKLYRILSDQTNHASIALVGDAHGARRTVVNAIVGTKLPKTVEVADLYCREKLGGVPSTPLTQPMRDALKAAMIEIAAALAGDAPPPTESPLTRAVRAALAREPAGAVADVQKLERICVEMTGFANDPSITTTKAMADKWIGLANAKLRPALPFVMGVVTKHLDASLPTTDQPLTAALRSSYAAVYSELAATMKAVAK